MTLDRYDRHILEILQAEGRISKQSLVEVTDGRERAV
jgi:DNA-binding Lrp family transcriptional regulator